MVISIVDFGNKIAISRLILGNSQLLFLSIGEDPMASDYNFLGFLHYLRTTVLTVS
jgi:hypothetical protein